MTAPKLSELEPLKPQVGQIVEIDTWPANSSEPLLPSDWDKADFRLGTGLKSIPSVAVNVKITGRTAQFTRAGYRVRIQIEWVGDCEPSTFSQGWLYIPFLNWKRQY